MLNFENLDGFVVDLSTEQLCNEILEDILCGDDKEFKKVIDLGIYSKREYITNYFADTYKYIFYKGNNVYQICEEELKTEDIKEGTAITTITELQDGYNSIKIERKDFVEYFIEKVGYANLYYICGTAKEHDVDNNYLKSFIDVAEEINFWGENEDE